MFSAFWDGSEYIVYLKDANGETKTTLAFDTGAVCTVLSIEALTNDPIDKQALCQKLDQPLYQKTYSGAVEDTDLQSMIAEATVSDF